MIVKYLIYVESLVRRNGLKMNESKVLKLQIKQKYMEKKFK